MSDSPKDDVVTFEQLGVDRLFVDESHLFKNLQTATKMNRVAGVSSSASKRAQDMYNKCRYMDELTGGRGIVFASGTSISNSMTEMYTLMRYLIHDRLAEYGIPSFDEWASAFGQTVSAIELSPEGKGYQQKTRFSRFFNLPELVSLFKTFADVRTSDMLDLNVPEAEYVDVTLEPSQAQVRQVEALVERAKRVRAGQVEPDQDNMLAITNDGRKAALDERLLDPALPPDEGSKSAACAKKAFEVWQETAGFKGTQLIFSDLSTPRTDRSYSDSAAPETDEALTDGSFTVYEDIRERLVGMGVPREEIIFIHEAKTDIQKAALFAKVRSGEVRFLLGSTQKMGAGVNVQDLLVALHHLDAPWRPADISQREGRILRQGNRNGKVRIFRYLKKGTFDQFMWQTLKNKQQFISQILTSRTPVRAAEDVDESVLQYSQVLALTVENPDIREKMGLDIEMEKLRTERSAYLQNQYRMQNLVSVGYPREIKNLEENIRNREEDVQTVGSVMERLRQKAPDAFEMRIGQVVCHKRKEAGVRLLAELFRTDWEDGTVLGEYMGLAICGQKRMMDGGRSVMLVGEGRYFVEMGMDAAGNLSRIDHLLAKLEPECSVMREKLEAVKRDMEVVRGQIGKVFEKEAEFQEKSARLAELNARLELGDGQDVLIEDPEGEPEEPGKVPMVDIKEIHCKDGTIKLRVSNYQVKHQFAGIYKNETVLPEEVVEKKAEILEKMERMEEKLVHPDFDDIIRETDDSLSGGLKTAHEMNGKVGTTGEQYCFLFRRIHSLLDVIKADGRVGGAMDKIKEYDAGHGKILEWEETAEGWKNEYMTIPDDDSVVKGWGVSKPYQMRIFCETAKREVIREAVRHLGDFEPEEQYRIAEQAFSEVSKSTHKGVDIHFEKDTAAIVVKMASAEGYILGCAFYGAGEWRYPEASVQEAYEDALRIYREIHEKQDRIERTVDVKELLGFAQGMKRSFSEGLIPEECYNQFVQMGRDVLK